MVLKNKNIIFKIRRSEVTDYAALIAVNGLHMQALTCTGSLHVKMCRDMRFPTMWYVQPATPQISLCIRAV